MNTLCNILVATDFSPASRAALLQGARLADANDAALHVLHVTPREKISEIASLMPIDPALISTRLADVAGGDVHLSPL